MRQGDPANLGKLRASVAWRDDPRWADTIMCAGLGAVFVALVTEYALTRTFAFHLRDIGPMAAVALFAAWLSRPASHIAHVGENGVSTTTALTFGASRRLLMFHTAARVEIRRGKANVTFVWYAADGEAAFFFSAPDTSGERVGFGHAAVDAFHTYQATARAVAGLLRSPVARARASARRASLPQRSHSTGPSRRRSANPFHRYRGRA